MGPDSWNSLPCFLVSVLYLHIPFDLQWPEQSSQSTDQMPSIPCHKPWKHLIVLGTKFKLLAICFLSIPGSGLTKPQVHQPPLTPWITPTSSLFLLLLSPLPGKCALQHFSWLPPPCHFGPTSKVSFLGFPDCSLKVTLTLVSGSFHTWHSITA